MRVWRTFGTVALCCGLLAACAAGVGEGPPDSYVVRPQDTLYSIAWRHDLDYRDLARWNHIGADFRISVGQVLLLGPGGPLTAARVPPPARSAARADARPQIQTQAKQSAARSGGEGAKWVWPTDRSGAVRSVPGGGILLSGVLGQDVRAASAGRVVYSGSGLRGYGNLIIIKHADSLLSAYAHNREMLVHDGQDVAAGQVIGHMGSAQQSPVLYFELRQNGKPIDPLPVLPK